MSHLRASAIALLLLALAAGGAGAEPGTAPPPPPAGGDAAPAGAPAADPAVTPPAATETPAAGYRLYVGDMLRIEVYDNPDLFRWIRIPPSGTFSFPLIGDVSGAIGRTVEDVTGELRRRLEADYLHRAVVTVTVTEFGARQAYVLGSVAVPGPVPLSATGSLTALQAIGNARGFVDDANRALVHLLRDDPAQPGRKTRIAIALPSDRGEPPVDQVLQPGDIVIVPRQDRVYIIGQVVKPGAVSLPSQEPLTVSKAVSLAGGFDRFARQGEVQLIRADQRTTVIDVGAILRGERRIEDPRLQPGDTVFVPESRF